MRFSSKSILLVLALAAAFLAGYWLRRPVGAANGARQPLYYIDPMHPAYKSDKPGIAPDCGMQLEPVYAGEDVPGSALAPGAIRIGAAKQQMMGLRISRVARSSGSHTLRVLGRVAPVESRIHRVTAQSEGVVRFVSSYAAGDIVKKDELLARYFVPSAEIYSAIQSFFMAASTMEQGLEQNPNKALMDSARAQLRLSEELLQTYGISEGQIKDMIRTRQVTRDIQFRSPVTGLVLSRSVALGQRVERGAEIFRIADLSRAWVLADVFENDGALIRPGMAGRVRYQGRTYTAVLTEARQFDPASRTLKVRLELDNPGLVLQPDMFVDVEFDVAQPEGIFLPVDGLLDSGRRKAVFVAYGDGSFEPREVITGTRFGDRVQVLKGLDEGEMVVVSGLFLLDSESRLRLPADGAASAPKAVSPNTDPVCGMQVDPAKAANQAEFDGCMYRFCSKACKAKFDHNPSRYARRTPVASAGGHS